MMELESPCKVNLVLNTLGVRADGFHELETLMLPVPWCDRIRIEVCDGPLKLTCSDATLAVDETNLVHKAARAFFTRTAIAPEVHIHLEKRIPMAAGLGGGSGNAATTLIGLNRMFGSPLASAALHDLASGLGSDVPFFLQSGPALAFGRGERVDSLPPFECLKGKAIVLLHPGFGISTPWAYQQLRHFERIRNGAPGRARALADSLRRGDLNALAKGLYNSLEAPALDKFPILKVYQELFRTEGALGTLMSGSGSTTFAIFEGAALAEAAEAEVKARFTGVWTATVEL